MEYVLEEKSVEVGDKIKVPRGSKIVGWYRPGGYGSGNNYVIIYLKPVKVN